MEASLASRTTNLLLMGLNHRSAPIEVRERLAFTNETLDPALRRLVDHHPLLKRRGFRLVRHEDAWRGLLASELWVSDAVTSPNV